MDKNDPRFLKAQERYKSLRDIGLLIYQDGYTDAVELESDRCEDCGAKLYSGPPDCFMCGAPNCCQQCCKITHQANRIIELKAELKSRECYGEWLNSNICDCVVCKWKREQGNDDG